MDKTILTLLGGASALAVAATGLATPAAAAEAPQSYADLLAPIPNAAVLLAAADADAAANEATEPEGLQLAQWHHHHHHHHWGWRWHHHHHHHHWGWRWHHHHHHHHHWRYY